MISPGASYTLEMTYNGSGNRNKVVGDSIFHCHFYPHFAAGMWAMWRTHDVFENGSEVRYEWYSRFRNAGAAGRGDHGRHSHAGPGADANAAYGPNAVVGIHRATDKLFTELPLLRIRPEQT